MSVVQKNVKLNTGTHTRDKIACLKYTEASFERNISAEENGIDMRMFISLFSNRVWQSALTPNMAKSTISTKYPIDIISYCLDATSGTRLIFIAV